MLLNDIISPPPDQCAAQWPELMSAVLSTTLTSQSNSAVVAKAVWLPEKRQVFHLHHLLFSA